MVAIYDPDDPDGGVVGTAPRDVMRAENLPHGATAVLVRRSTGEIYVHRRADTKDLWPGRHDCAVGGVLQAGEDPDEAAVRELAEELGIEGAVLTPLVRRWYSDADTCYFAYAYVTTWDGAVRFADGEVADGWWEEPSVLYDRLQDPSWPFVPDTRALLDLPQTRAVLLGEPA
ncbi:MAG TPA: NUDIX domain-containing protein [Propionibacteriaceae bacterium]